jgi:hypothetical protein
MTQERTKLIPFSFELKFLVLLCEPKWEISGGLGKVLGKKSSFFDGIGIAAVTADLMSIKVFACGSV